MTTTASGVHADVVLLYKLNKIKKPYLSSLIMYKTTLAHELFCDITISLTDTALLYLPSTAPLYASVSKGAANTIFTPLVWCGHGI